MSCGLSAQPLVEQTVAHAPLYSIFIIVNSLLIYVFCFQVHLLSPESPGSSEPFEGDQGLYAMGGDETSSGDDDSVIQTDSRHSSRRQRYGSPVSSRSRSFSTSQFSPDGFVTLTSPPPSSVTGNGQRHPKVWSPTESNSGHVATGRSYPGDPNHELGEYGARIASFAMALGGRYTIDSTNIVQNDCDAQFGKETPIGIEDEDEGTHDKRIDHKLLNFFYQLCSVREQQIPIHITAHVDDLSINLHDAYVQLLQVRVVKTNVKAVLPMVKEASITLDVLMGLTTYNPLTSSTERALDPVGIRFAIRRRLAGDYEKEDCPWLEMSLNMDRLGLDVSSGLLQVIRRLQDLFGTTRSKTKTLGKTKTVTIYNDLKAPIILLQRGLHRGTASPDHRGAIALSGGNHRIEWNHLVLDERQCCSSLVESPMFFAVKRIVEKKVTTSGTTTSVIGLKRFKEKKGHRNSVADATMSLKAHIETEEDITRLAFELLKLGNNSFTKHLNDFLRFYQKPLLFGTTRNVEFILELLAEQLPTLAGSLKARWGGVGSVFNILRNEPGWVPVGKLRPDYQTNRAYFIAGHGFKIVVEPETEAASGDWKLCIGTAIQIVNVTSIPFKIFTSKRFGAVRRFAKRLQGDLPAPIARAQEARAEARSPHCIVINPHSRKSVPLSWFFNGRSPFILPLIDDEQTESIFSKLGGEFHGNRLLNQNIVIEAGGGKTKRHNISIAGLGGAASSPFQQLVTPQPFQALQRLLSKLSGPETDESWKRITVEDSVLRYRRQLAWDGKRDT